MATGPEHYAEAERLLGDALNPRTGNLPYDDDATSSVRNTLAAAQVHSTLALAAAAGLNDAEGGKPDADHDEWRNVAGTTRTRAKIREARADA